ncbi:hypothetical protein ABIB90_000479 [Bradyrhizobium sp. JR4.1]
MSAPHGVENEASDNGPLDPYRKRLSVHLTPTSSSWLNQVERFFPLLTDKKIRRGNYRSVAALRADITSFIDRHKADPKPFRWTKSADDILASIFHRTLLPIQCPGKTQPNVANFWFRTLDQLQHEMGLGDR